jgi:hypothetical protein
MTAISNQDLLILPLVLIVIGAIFSMLQSHILPEPWKYSNNYWNNCIGHMDRFNDC